MVRMGRAEDDVGRSVPARRREARGRFDAAQSGHANVEQDDVDVALLDALDDRRAVLAFRDQLEPLDSTQESPQAPSRELLVVADQNAKQ